MNSGTRKEKKGRSEEEKRIFHEILNSLKRTVRVFVSRHVTIRWNPEANEGKGVAEIVMTGEHRQAVIWDTRLTEQQIMHLSKEEILDIVNSPAYFSPGKVSVNGSSRVFLKGEVMGKLFEFKSKRSPGSALSIFTVGREYTLGCKPEDALAYSADLRAAEETRFMVLLTDGDHEVQIRIKNPEGGTVKTFACNYFRRVVESKPALKLVEGGREAEDSTEGKPEGATG